MRDEKNQQTHHDADELALRRFQNANDNRKNEIELLWKRSAFFWGFIALIFAGYGALLESNAPLSLLVASFGIVSSACWYITNASGAFWQKVWERNVMHDEEMAIGRRVYDNIPEGQITRSSILLGSRRYSLSGTAIALSNYVFAFWLILTIFPLVDVLPRVAKLPPDPLPTVAYCWLLISLVFVLRLFHEAGRHPSLPNAD